MWKSDPWRLYHIGNFFTDLAQEILGGEKTAGSTDSGDINNWDLDTQIEVKGCSNRNSPKIYSEQLSAEIQQLGFPLSCLWYVIFFYRNQGPRPNRDKSLIKKIKTAKAFDVFLCKNTMDAFVIFQQRVHIIFRNFPTDLNLIFILPKKQLTLVLKKIIQCKLDFPQNQESEETHEPFC